MLKEMINMLKGGKGSSSGPSLDRQLAQADAHLENFDTLFLPAPESKPRTPFDAHDVPPEKISMLNMTIKQILKLVPVFIPLQRGMAQSNKLYDGKFRPTQEMATPEFIAELEAIALKMGATAVKYVKVPPHAIFQGKGIPHEYAVVFTVEMDKDNIETAPSFEAMKEVISGYKNLAAISNKMAKFMRQHGFGAYPGTAVGGLTDYPHLAELAGLGAIGYHGLLITPHDGTRLRLNTIYTNITNLPLETENEHVWVRDFCAMCKKCVRECPAKAIFDEPRPRGDGGMQCIDHDSCRNYFTSNYGCAVCVAVCPFSHTGYDKIQAKFKGNPTAPQFRIPLAEIGIMKGEI